MPLWCVAVELVTVSPLLDSVSPKAYTVTYHSARDRTGATQNGVSSMDPLAYSIEAAAEQLGIGRTLMFDLVRRGNLPSVKLGKRRLIPAQSLRDWLAAQVDQNRAA